MLLLYYYYILIMISLYSYFDIMLLFLKKSNQKTRSICNALVCEGYFAAPYTIMCWLYISHTLISIIWPYSLTPQSVFNTIFLLYCSLFCDFFHNPSMVVPSNTFSPLYFSFFCFSKISSFSFSSCESHQRTILRRVSHI